MCLHSSLPSPLTINTDSSEISVQPQPGSLWSTHFISQTFAREMLNTLQMFLQITSVNDLSQKFENRGDFLRNRFAHPTECSSLHSLCPLSCCLNKGVVPDAPLQNVAQHQVLQWQQLMTHQSHCHNSLCQLTSSLLFTWN